MSLLYYQHDLSEIQGNIPDNPVIKLDRDMLFSFGCSGGPVFLKPFELFKNILIDSDDVHMQLMNPTPSCARMGRDSLSLLSGSEKNVRIAKPLLKISEDSLTSLSIPSRRQADSSSSARSLSSANNPSR